MPSKPVRPDELQLPTNGKVTKAASVNKKLPLARVKKIAKMDEDVIAISNAAALIIAGAAEKFAAYYAEQSFFFTLAEKKKGLSYRHCAAAVARLPQLDFLADVVPQTVKFSDTEHGRKFMAKQKNAHMTTNDNDIPEWARAHPEALSKIQAAQEMHRANGSPEEAPDQDEIAPSITTLQPQSTSKKSLSPTLPLLLNDEIDMSDT